MKYSVTFDFDESEMHKLADGRNEIVRRLYPGGPKLKDMPIDTPFFINVRTLPGTEVCGIGVTKTDRGAGTSIRTTIRQLMEWSRQSSNP